MTDKTDRKPPPWDVKPGQDARDRYLSDPQFRTLVDLMLSHILRCDFTPSEMRLAAMLASIKYEQMSLRKMSYPEQFHPRLKEDEIDD